MQKMTRMSAHGHISVWMGVVGLVAWGEQEKFQKKFEIFKKIAIFGNTGSLRQN